MKPLLCGSFFAALLLVLLGGETPEPSQKYAFLVGIDQYPRLPNLSGSRNDVADMKALLIERFGFLEANIFTLTDAQATRANILARFESELIDKVKDGDMALFHFSGHGSQMIDVSGDEPDGKDETLVPYDSREEGVFDISDDEIHGLLERLLQRGAKVTFIFDSCHSSGGQRPGSWRKVSADTRPPPEVAGGVMSSDEGGAGLGALNNPDYVFISACGSTEVAGEIQVGNRMNGALTHHLVKALREAEDEVTWSRVVEQVVLGVHRRYRGQTPQLQGRGDSIVFGTEERPDHPHFLVTEASEGGVVLNGGAVHGLTVDSVFEIFPAGKIDETEAGIARIGLTAVEPLKARARVLEGGPVPEGAWAVEREHHYEGPRLHLAFQDLGDSAVLRALRDALAGDRALEIIDETERALVVIVHDAHANTILLQDEKGHLLGRPLAASDPNAVRRAVRQWARWFRVRAIESEGARPPEIAFTITRGKEELLAVAGDEAQGLARCKPGDILTLKLVNRSRRNLYFTVLLLEDTGEISEFYPRGKGYQPFPPGGKGIWEKPIQVTLQKGARVERTILKVFATLRPVNLGYLKQARIRSAAGPHPLEALLGPDSRSANLPPARWTAAQLTLEVNGEGPD